MALPDYADFLQDWVGDQTRSNFMLVGETYDQSSGAYRNNAPMIGFGSGSWISAMWQRYGDRQDAPACGIYFEDDPLFGPDVPGEDTGVDAGADAGTDTDIADTTPVDTGVADTTPVDTGAADTTPADTTPADTTPADTEVADTTPADTEVADTSADTVTADTTPADTGITDTGRDTTVDTVQGGADTSRSEPTVAPSGCSSAQGGFALWQLLAAVAMVARRTRRRLG
jgi:hypothetical protein